MSLNLSYCQLIKIILSQIGGNPLQQAYTQLSEGMHNMTTRGLIPTELAQVKEFVDRVTEAINAVSGDINAEQILAGQFIYNPVGAATTAAIAAIDLRLAQEPADPELTDLTNLRADLVIFKANSDQLAGVTPPSTTNGFGGCTLADLLGTGCAKAGNVPDVDLQTLINGFKSGEAIKGLQKNVEIMIAQGTGYDKLQNAVVGFHNTVTNFNNTVTNKLNPLIIKRAVENYITNLAYNLLTGCGNQLLTTTIRPEVLSNIAPYIALVSSKIDNTNTSYVDQTGTTVQPANTTLNT
jgi:hypothetical protein